MKIKVKNNIFYCNKFTKEEKELLSANKFIWSSQYKLWYTTQPQVAASLRAYLDDSAKSKLASIFLKVTPWTAPLACYYPDGKALMPHQEIAVRHAMSVDKSSYLALDPGLGKTPIAGILSNILDVPILYICPPFLCQNVKAKLTEWDDTAIRSPKMIEIYDSDSIVSFGCWSAYLKWANSSNCVLIIPDSIIDRKSTYEHIIDFLEDHPNAALIVDEAQRFKSFEANRTKALYQDNGDMKAIARLGWSKIVLLSGDPMPNRPIELYPVLSTLAPETINFMNEEEYGKKYCDGKLDMFGRWDFSGASNLDELAEKVKRVFMLRMKKSEVLKDLPKKTKEIVLLNDDLPPDMIEYERAILKKYSPHDLVKTRIEAKIFAESGKQLHIATYRRELGLLKVKSSLAFVKDILENTDEAVLIFAIHIDVIKALVEGLKKYNPLMINGSVNKKKRDAIIKEFQTDLTRKVLVGNIASMGIGNDIQKASVVIMIEWMWTPGDNTQAEDRAHRIGQTRPVHVPYLVFRNSIDSKVLEINFKKEKVIGHV